MAATQPQQETSLQVRRTFAAPRERVFRAWTDAKEFALWFHPSADIHAIVTRMDLKVGGKYSLEMHHKDGNIHRLSGSYQQIKVPEKLVFSWRWETDPPGQESIVRLDFVDLGEATELRLVHGELPNTEQRKQHEHGWIGCLGSLAEYLSLDDKGPVGSKV